MKNILVVGGGGFVGSALLRGLGAAGYRDLACFDRVPCPVEGVRSLVGDLTVPAQVLEACRGVDTVFQTAALVDWGPRSRERLHAINVQGNRNVLRACRELGVERLVYTSSIDVVFDGRPIAGGDESLPVPARHLDDYGASKALAERETLQASDPRGLQTCALRAAGVYGPGDRHRFPPILAAVRAGQMLHLGDGKARFNHVYVGNLVQAHLRAAETLAPGSAPSGQAYFVTDHEPGNFFAFFTPYLQALGLAVPTRRLAAPLALAVATAMEALARLGVGSRPLLTRYVVLSTCRDFWFTSARAERDFGYRPVVSREQAFDETLAWLRDGADASA